MISLLELIGMLLVWHALADYPLQGDFLARAKNRYAPVPGVPWQWAMGAHCAIHAGGVWMITNSSLAALAMFVTHWFIDDEKCQLSSRLEGARAQAFAFHVDQASHVVVIACIAVIVWCFA